MISIERRKQYQAYTRKILAQKDKKGMGKSYCRPAKKRV